MPAGCTVARKCITKFEKLENVYLNNLHMQTLIVYVGIAIQIYCFVYGIF